MSDAAKTPPPERILVVRLSALGDVLFALPALRKLREALPKARISFLVEDRFADLLHAHPDLDELIVFERKRIARLDARAATRLVRELRRRRFDVALDFQGNLKSGVLTRLSGAKLRVGFASPPSREGNVFFSNRRVAPPPGARWRPERDLALLAGLGIATEPGDALRATPPRFGPDETSFAAECDSALAGRGPLVVLHAGTSAFGAFKRWAPERFGALARDLAERAGARVLATHGPGEKPLAEAVAAAAGGAAAVAPATRSLRHLAALLARADLVVGADTGPVHVAAVLGRPVIAVFGPKDPETYRPLGALSRVARRDDVACSPCRLRYCPRPDCLIGLGEDRVLALALDLLSGSRKSPDARAGGSSASSRSR